MPYIRRDSAQKIVASSTVKNQTHDEFIDASSQEYREFIEESKKDLAKTDSELARITEDLIDLLIEKQIILFTDFPEAVQNKLLERERLRNQINPKNHSFLDEE